MSLPLVSLGILCLFSAVGFANVENSVITTFQRTRIELPCKVWLNESEVRYSWKLNGSYLPISFRRYTENANLIIRYIDRSQDTGRYTCEARDTRKKNVTVADPIFVRVHWIDENVSVGLLFPKRELDSQYAGDITLQCHANGSGNLKIYWSKNGEGISNGNKISLENNLLRIRDVTNKENGVYRCSASNDAGYAVVSFKNFVLRLPSNNCAVLSAISNDQIVKEGDDVVLDCIYENYDLLEWYFKEGGPLENTSRFTVFSNGSLFVKNVTKAVEGMYSCVGVRKECENYPSKYTAILSIANLENSNSSMLEPSSAVEHVVAEGKNFSIACLPPPGFPAPVVTWRNQLDEIISNNTDARVKVDGYNLEIDYAKKPDGGSYICRAQNLAGFIESSFSLTVAVSPIVVQDPRSQTVLEGSEVSFNCQYEGTAYPFTTIAWLKNEVLLTANTSAVTINGTKGSLRLFNAQSSDTGEYTCVVYTNFFDAVKSRDATLTMIQKLKFNPLPVAKKMELGLANKIPCKAEGSDPPTIKWKKENMLGESVPFPKHVQDLNGTLLFSNVQSEDKGRYVCIASNSQGAINVTIDVDVVVTPKFVVLPKNPSEGYEGYAIRLDCAAEGNPLPTIQWDSNVVDTSQRRFTTLTNGSLLISELHPSDAGTYGCTAGNSGGFNRTEILLTIKTSDEFRTDGSVDNIEGDTVGRTIVITLGAATAYILLVVVLMAWCRYRRKRKKQAYAADTQVDSVPMDDEEIKHLQRDDSELKESYGIQNGDVKGVKCETSHSKYVAENYADLKFSRTCLHDVMLLGNGELGNVYLARNKCDYDAVVMIKVLEKPKSEFVRQLDVLKHVQHEHIVKLIGICWEAEPLYMVLEYTDWGDLKQFLIATRKSSVRVVGSKQRPPPLTLQQSLNIVQQAAFALEHISLCRCTHKDVAARNCLITSSLRIKITFSSLCKDTYATEYYEIRDQIVPLRWWPLEAVINDEFSAQTDVYSYACLVWEIFTKGELPFSKLSNEEVLNLLERHQLRWKLPKSLPLAFSKLLNKCWSTNATERPSFSEILKELTEIINSLVSQT